MTYIQYIQQC